MQIEGSKSSSSSFDKQLARIMASSPGEEFEMRLHSGPSSKSDLFERLARSYSRGSDRASEQKMSIQEEKPTDRQQNVHNCVCQVFGDCLGVKCNCFLSTLPCSPGCCPTCITLKNTVPAQSMLQQNPCACKRTKCLMLYCQCLANNKYCTTMCHCYTCENHEHSADRKKRQPDRFLRETETRTKACKCLKTRCDKKYCNCYNSGLTCSLECKCTNCSNGKPAPPPKVILPVQRFQPKQKLPEPIGKLPGPRFQFQFN